MCSTASGAAPPERLPRDVEAEEEDAAADGDPDVPWPDAFVALRPPGASASAAAFESPLSSDTAESRDTGPIRPVVEDPAGFAVGLPR